MQKIFIMVSCLLVSLSFVAAINPQDANAHTIRYENDVNVDGSYNYAYETSNNIQSQEDGVGSVYAAGNYAYTSPEGQLIQLQYTADENGYQPRGAHLPTPPPIPAYILRSLEYIESHPFERIYLAKN